MNTHDGEEKNKEYGILPPNKDVFQEEWDQHGQMLGNKVKVRIKNWSQASH